MKDISQRPNILILYTDQQRVDTLGCYGQGAIETPNIDSLANDGVRLGQYYVQNPVCAPSRASFLTGKYCSSLHIGTNGISFPKSERPISQLVKPYGYDTAQIGKLHFDPHARRDHRNPTDTYGFDTFILSDEPGCYDDAYTKWVENRCPEQLGGVRTMLPPAAARWGRKGYSSIPRDTHEPYVFGADASLTHTAFVTDQMCDYLRRHDVRKPFLAIAGYYAPHPPLNPPQEYIDRVDRSKLRLPIVGPEDTVNPILREMTESRWMDVVTAYLAMVAQVDDGVGEIIEVLKEQNIYDNTIIVFTSDHGEFLGDHGHIQKGMPGHDCIIHVPCIICYPNRLSPGRVCDTLTAAVDIVPTLLDFCGIQTPAFVQGKSMRKLLQGQTDVHRDAVLIEYFEEHGNRQTTVRTERYKYFLHENGEELLFDLSKDCNEHYDVSKQPAYADALSQMRFTMLRELQQAAYYGHPQTDEY